MNVLTIEEAAQYAPQILTNRPADGVSDHYNFVSTKRILETVQENGWCITGAVSGGASRYAQHSVSLVHRNDVDRMATTTLEGVPRIILTNSHNRAKRLAFHCGYFRFVCSNGIVIASGPATQLRMRHTGNEDTIATLMNQVNESSGSILEAVDNIEQLRSRNITKAQQLEYGKFALSARYKYMRMPKKILNQPEIYAGHVLTPNRPEDEGDSLWSVFNRVQENLIKGRLGVFTPVKGFISGTTTNQLLWNGAMLTLNNNNPMDALLPKRPTRTDLN